MAAVVERHVVEARCRPSLIADRPRVGPVGDAERLAVEVDQLLHVVHRALQVADVHADVAQIALHHEEGGEHVGDVARRGPAAATTATAQCRRRRRAAASSARSAPCR